MFLLEINDAVTQLEDYAHVLAIKYVDDVTLIENLRGRQPNITLPSALNVFTQWTIKNNMNLNTDKCVLMEVCFMKEPPPRPQFTIQTIVCRRLIK